MWYDLLGSSLATAAGVSILRGPEMVMTRGRPVMKLLSCKWVMLISKQLLIYRHPKERKIKYTTAAK